MDWQVKEVIPTTDFKLHLTFKNGEKKVFDFTQMFSDKRNEPLKDINLFMKAHVEYHSVAWTDQLDICPEFLYEESVPE